MRKLWGNVTIGRLFAELGIFMQLSLVRNIVDLVVGGFFIIFVYKVTGRFEYVAIASLFQDTATFIGFVASVRLMDKLNYFSSMKISFLLDMLVYLIVVLFFASLNTNLILLVTFLHGLAIGMYYANANLYQLVDMKSDNRQPIFVSMESASHLLGTLLPILIGFLIIEKGYQSSFLLGVIVYFFGLFIPTNIKLPKGDLYRWSEFRLMTKLKGFMPYSIILVGLTFVSEFRNLAFALVPFLLLGRSELNVGLLAGTTAFIAGTFGLLLRNTKHTGKYAYLSAWFFVPLNLMLGILWNPFAVAIRAILSPISSVFYNSQTKLFEFNNIQTLLGHHLQQDSVEMQVHKEAMLLIARILSSLLFAWILSLGTDFYVLTRSTIILFAGWPVVIIIANQWIHKRLVYLKTQS